MATITKPAAFGFADIQAGYEHAQGVGTNPYNLRTVVDDYGGKRRLLTVSTPPLAGTDRSAWVTFVNDLKGAVNTFTVDISDYFPGEAGTVSFRMVQSPQWRWVMPNYIQLSFTAVEVVA